MILTLSVAALLLYTAVVSQPLFYALALGRAARGLSAAAYVELRQRINAVIASRLLGLYVVTLLTLIVLVAVALVRDASTLAIGAGLAACGLIADTVLAVKLNVPINDLVNGFRLDAIPEDWRTHRDRWDAAMAVRRVVLLAAFVALVLGTLSDV